MVYAIEGDINAGRIQLFCVDSINMESWYNRCVPPRWRIARHIQYEEYIREDVLPLVREWNGPERPITLGCSLGDTTRPASLCGIHPPFEASSQ